jgi:hypothetical protein
MRLASGALIFCCLRLSLSSRSPPFAAFSVLSGATAGPIAHFPRRSRNLSPAAQPLEFLFVNLRDSYSALVFLPVWELQANGNAGETQHSVALSLHAVQGNVRRGEQPLK